MKYQIYSLDTKEALRLVDTLEYNLDKEGYIQVPDILIGNLVWYPNTLWYSDPDDSLYNITPLDFLKRFTLEERVALHSLSVTSPIVRDMMFMLILTTKVDTRGDDVYKSLEYLNVAGIITDSRKAVIRGY
jgi:hypothetical protein